LRREHIHVPTTDTVVTVACVLLALPAAYAVGRFTGRFDAATATLLIVGVVVPMLYRETVGAELSGRR
jgi:ABC-type spermidine/putrescine transport system permease subunit I